MRRAYKFRLYPTRLQREALERQIETHRRLYNAALEQRRIAWREQRVSLNYYAQANELKDARRADAELRLTNYSSLQTTLRRLDRTFQAFFRRVRAGEQPGFPRFKGRDRFNSVTFPSVGDGCRFDGQRVYVQHAGRIKTKVHRPVEGTIKTITFKREAGQWYAVLSCDLGAPDTPASILPPVGIDLGLTAFLTTSDGEAVVPPRYYRQAQAKLRRVQRALSRCQRGSHRRAKVKRRVQRTHQRIANQRRDWHHKAALNLCRQYGTICHEALNVRGIARTRLAKSTHDAGWGQFLTILAHKAEEADVAVIAVNPRNTTQVCSACGGLPPVPLTLSDRVYVCSHCGLVSNRDVNAARNVLRLGLSRQASTLAVAGVA